MITVSDTVNNTADSEPRWSVTRNTCKLCAPLGASLVFAGVERSMNLLHGSQGCATYIRRYLISHFREPLDIASSSFTEETAVFGGKDNLLTALDNLTQQYHPALIGVTSTCLAETMGEDTGSYLKSWYNTRSAEGAGVPFLIDVSAPSYQGSHREGFQKALTALIRYFCNYQGDKTVISHPKKVVILSAFLSPADQRWLKQMLTVFCLPFILVPDYSQTLDGGPWPEYRLLPEGGTKIEDLKSIKNCQAVIELGALPEPGKTGGEILAEAAGVKLYSLPLPIGIKNTDRFLQVIGELSGQPAPANINEERQRLIDSYVDGHKYVFGIKTLLYGEEDFVAGMAVFLNETGLIPCLCATGGRTTYLEKILKELPAPGGESGPEANRLIKEADFVRMEEALKDQTVELMIGNSKGYKLAGKKNIPFIRAGFPIHDRFGGGRLLHLGYEGAQQLFDRIVNALIEKRQAENPAGYTYY